MLRLLPKRGWYTGSLDDRRLSRSNFFHHFHKRTEHTLFPRPHFQRQNVQYYDCHIKGSKGMHWYGQILADTNYKTLCIDRVNGGFPVFILRENKITFKTSSCLYIGNKDSRLLNIFQLLFRQRGTRAITDLKKSLYLDRHFYDILKKQTAEIITLPLPYCFYAHENGEKMDDPLVRELWITKVFFRPKEFHVSVIISRACWICSNWRGPVASLG